MNPDARVLSWKSTAPLPEEPGAIPPADLWLPDETPSPAVTEEMLQEITETAEKAERRNPPVQIKRFSIE